MVKYYIDSKVVAPQNPKAHASSFSQWVFEQTVEKKGFKTGIPINKNRLELGTYTHQLIDEFYRTQWAIRKLKPITGDFSDLLLDLDDAA
mgnify:CR=1 FL=1